MGKRVMLIGSENDDVDYIADGDILIQQKFCDPHEADMPTRAAAAFARPASRD